MRGYRYPFTPYPKGWYRIDTTANNLFVFGHEYTLDKDNAVLSSKMQPEKTLPVVFKNAAAFAWYDNEQQLPYYEVPEVTELSDRGWQKPFYLAWKQTRVHIQEVAENALDLSHFCTVHTYHDIPTLSRFETFGHQFNVIMHSRRKVLGMMAKTTMDITYHGMGVTVANVYSSNHVVLKVLLTTTPIDQEHVDINMAIALKKSRNPLQNILLRYLLPRDIRAEFTRDIPVWEAKIYRDKPMVCQAEANIIRIRKWARQFY